MKGFCEKRHNISMSVRTVALFLIFAMLFLSFSYISVNSESAMQNDYVMSERLQEALKEAEDEDIFYTMLWH